MNENVAIPKAEVAASVPLKASCVFTEGGREYTYLCHQDFADVLEPGTRVWVSSANGRRKVTFVGWNNDPLDPKIRYQSIIGLVATQEANDV